MTFLSVLQAWLVTFLALLLLANPFESIPTFVELSAGKSPEERSRLTRRVCILAAVMMVGSLVLGGLLMRIAGVSPPAVLVAGGLVLLGLGFRMLITGKAGLPTEHLHPDEHDPALFPLAFPSVCGPGAIAALMSASSYIQRLDTAERMITGYAITLAAIAAVCLAAFVILRLAAVIARRLGATGLVAMSRFMGLFLIVIGVQLLADGVAGFIAEGDKAETTPAIPMMGDEGAAEPSEKDR